MSSLEITSLSISIIALTLSLMSFWNSTLSPFRLKVHNNAPTFYLDKIEYSPGRTWWIPGFDIEISLYNMGIRSGEILDIRIIAKMQEDNGDKIYFYPKWLVNHSEHNKSKNRSEWIANAIIRDWYPMILRGKDEEHLHLILESDRWEKPRDYHLALSLEIATSKSKGWKAYRTYDLSIPEEIFSTGDKYTPLDEKIHKLRAEL